MDGALVLPEPLGKQPEWLDSPATRKILRVGRRGTKTRFAFLAALTGHGPGWEDGTPALRGVLQGGDVVWIAQNYTNLSTVLWREEIVPRMSHLPWITLNTTKHDVEIPGVGALMLRSGDREAIDSIRGIGKTLLGVIIDEAAWLDLRGALLDVILLALADNDGWLVIMSTTNAGSDGGYDDQGAPQIPSYFNVLCEEIRAGKRSGEWQEFTGTAFDNPSLNPQAIADLIAEYPADSPKLKQEVFAELLKAGSGLALPLLCAARHLMPRFPVPRHWQQFGGFDWGFNHPWVFGWYCVDEDGNVVKIETLWGREDLPDAIATTILSSVPATKFITYAGLDIFQHKGKAVGFKGPTIAEALQAHGMLVTEASNARVLGLNNLRTYTHFDPIWPITGDDARHPRFRLMDTEGNRRCLAQLQAMQVDPKDHEDVLKIDADYAGRGGDDSYDETRYALMSRPLTSASAPAAEKRQRETLGYDYENRRPHQRKTAEDEIAQILRNANPSPTAGRYRVPQRRG